jgi:hypothetical protein
VCESKHGSDIAKHDPDFRERLAEAQSKPQRGGISAENSPARHFASPKTMIFEFPSINNFLSVMNFPLLPTIEETHHFRTDHKG